MNSDFNAKYEALKTQKQNLILARNLQVAAWEKEVEMKTTQIKSLYNDVPYQLAAAPMNAQINELHQTFRNSVQALDTEATTQIKMIENNQKSLQTEFDNYLNQLVQFQSNPNDGNNGNIPVQNEEKEELMPIEADLEQIAPQAEEKCDENNGNETKEEELEIFCECELLEGQNDHKTRIECYLCKIEMIANEMQNWMNKNESLAASIMANEDKQRVIQQRRKIAHKLKSLIDAKLNKNV